MIGTNAAGLMAPCLKLTYSRLPKIARARIIHERFCCNRRFAAATSLRPAESPLGPSPYYDYGGGWREGGRRTVM